jgi:hypothetical protein
MITVPANKVGEFLYEIDRAKTTGEWKRFRLSRHIRSPKDGDRAYVVYDGKIRGYMPIIGLEWNDGFICTTTGIKWAEGQYLLCKMAEYKELLISIECKGFQGIRRVDFEKFPKLKRNRGVV